MLAETTNQHCLTRAAVRTCRRAKSKFLSVVLAKHMKTTHWTGLVSLVLLLSIIKVSATDLAIHCSGNQVVLSWPLASTNDFYLQTTTNLLAPVAWSNAADPVTNGNSLVVMNPIPSTSTFYRLKAWEVLFDGTNTASFGSGTAFPSNSWFVTNRMLTSKVVANAGNLVTVSTYTNFELRLSWKCETNGNSGIFYRAGTSPEYQLFDDANVATSHYTDNIYLDPVNLMGAVYKYIPAMNKHLVPTGQWDDCRVIVQGYHATHWLNGNVVVDYQINDPSFVNIFVQATNTQIAFQNKGTGDHGVVPGVVYFGHIKIRRLP